MVSVRAQWMLAIMIAPLAGLRVLFVDSLYQVKSARTLYRFSLNSDVNNGAFQQRCLTLELTSLLTFLAGSVVQVEDRSLT